jgi:DNA invertase Pin-like site-specific DNA recombinase
MPTASRYANPRSNRRSGGLWELRYEPGPNFPWGVVARRSMLNADGREESTQDQGLETVRYIKDNKLGRIVRSYTDIASGFHEDANRPDYENALDDLRAGVIGGIAVWKFDRLTRRILELYRIIELLRTTGGRLLSVVEEVDTGDPDKQLQNSMFLKNLHDLAVMAEGESANTSRRILRWHAKRANMGIVHRGGLRPMGHSEDWFSLVAEEVEVLHEAGKRILADVPTARITSEWTAKGVMSTTGRPWQPATLKRVLMQPRMIGHRESGGQLLELEDVPAIFDRETWEAICAKLEGRSQHGGRRESHLCSNLALCAVCGRPLITCHDGKGQAAYACKKRPVEPGACGGIWITRAFLDERVTQEALAFLSDRQRIEAVLHGRATGPDMAAVHARMDELAESEVALTEALNPPPGMPRMPRNLIFEQYAAIEEERRELNRSLAINRESSALVEALEFGDKAAEVWAERPIEWRRRILGLICKRVEIVPFRGLYAKGKRGGSALDPERVRITFADE